MTKYILLFTLMALSCQQESAPMTYSIDDVAERYCERLADCDPEWYQNWEGHSSCEYGILANMGCHHIEPDLSTASQCMDLLDAGSCVDIWPFLDSEAVIPWDCWGICDGD
jgi:hypothetical protein